MPLSIDQIDDKASSAELRLQQQRLRADPEYFRKALSAVKVTGQDVDCSTALQSPTEAEPAPAIDIPVDAVKHAIPGVAVLGYLDHFTDPLVARAADRIAVSGWAFARETLAPVRQVRIRMAGKTLATFGDFYARPEVGTLFGRRELLEVGFQGLVFLPRVRSGEYQLEAVTHNGDEHVLPPRPAWIE